MGGITLLHCKAIKVIACVNGPGFDFHGGACTIEPFGTYYHLP